MLAIFRRPVAVSIVTIASACGLSTGAWAVCNTSAAPGGLSGPPSMSASDTSTTAVLELIRARREQAMASDPTLVASAPAGPAAGEGPAATVAKGAPKARPKRAAPPAGAPPGAAPAPIEEDVAIVAPRYGTWAEAYADFERHTNIIPGASGVSRNQSTYGMAAGFDRTFRNTGWSLSAFQIGVFGGYNHTRSTFSPRTTIENRSVDGGPAELVSVTTTDSEQESNGGFVGAYTSYLRGAFSGDLSIKVDFFDLTQTATETLLGQCATANVFDNPLATNFLSNSTSETNVILAGNANWRMPWHGGFWFEPTAGFRLTLTSYGDNAAAIGLEDGHALRLQAGARVGRTWLEGGKLWSVSAAGLLYSDVLVDGYLLTTAALPPGTAEVDEGKLRVMGQLNAKVDFLDGTSLYGRVEVRGGEDVIGVGGKLGARIEW